MVKCAVLLFVFLLMMQVGFCNPFVNTNDSLDIKERIKTRYNACRKLFKKHVIYKLNADTLLLLGRNRDETIIGYIGVEDFKNNESKIFIYDSIGLFQVTVREKMKRAGSRKGQVCYYVFENGVVIWKVQEEVVRFPAQLLREAAFLRDYVTPFRTSLR